MENFLMNLLAVAAIIAMLYSVLVMWRNIDKELGKMEAGGKITQVSASSIKSGNAKSVAEAMCPRDARRGGKVRRCAEIFQIGGGYVPCRHL